MVQVAHPACAGRAGDRRTADRLVRRQSLGAGTALVAAAGQATRDRFRAIFISSTTTIAGLLPLLAETSTQSMAIKPLVVSVVFGLLGSTVLVLLIIPALYVILDDLGWAGDARS